MAPRAVAVWQLPAPMYPGEALARSIREGPWAHPRPEAQPEPTGRASVMDDEQWGTFKRMLARQAKVRRTARRTARKK